VQLVDDAAGKTLVAGSEKSVKVKGKSGVERAKKLGKLIATAAKKKKIAKVVFERGGYQYHGRVEALAEGMREGGLEF